MPAKKVTPKSAILNAAVTLISQKGLSGVNTKNLTQILGCSTQPIYHAYKNVEELKRDAMNKIMEIYSAYLSEEVAKNKYPPYKSYGMGYIKFAANEPQLFKVAYMSAEAKNYLPNFNSLTDIFGVIAKSLNVSKEVAQKFHLDMWFSIHGLASMIACDCIKFCEEEVSRYLTDIFFGLKHVYLNKEN
ncbi:MAG: TetR/AcrR family transcriptional regulator [Clostridia bacterium]|nr:TetR/AcrR family transcriptional regulator [Clostridia bacterium]